MPTSALSTFDLSVLFFLQAAVIILSCRACAWVLQRAGQPPVVAEMIAGVLLGPSLLGLLAPEVSAYLFPPQSKPILFAVAQFGLVLYMFTVGLEFNAQHVRDQGRSAAAVSFAGIAAPFVLGATLAWAVFDWPGLFSARTSPTQAMLFMGAAMAITAFPMLARILAERGIAGSRMGTLALAAGASDDAIAWCVLALVLASFESKPSLAFAAIGGMLAFAFIVLALIRPWLARLDVRSPDALRSPEGLSVTMAGLMLCAWFTDIIQIYAVFGAFVLGAAMPRNKAAGQSESVSEHLIKIVRPLCAAVVLPFFFTYSGLNTQIALVNTPALWLLALGIIVIATLGKGVACYFAARWTGQGHTEAASVGALMNARGLMELIILNIGLQRGIIEPTLFTLMVLMAIFTTLTATPVFDWVQKRASAGAERSAQ